MVKVRRIVANIETPDAAAAKRFYQEVLGPRYPHGSGLDCHLRLR